MMAGIVVGPLRTGAMEVRTDRFARAHPVKTIPAPNTSTNTAPQSLRCPGRSIARCSIRARNAIPPSRLTIRSPGRSWSTAMRLQSPTIWFFSAPLRAVRIGVEWAFLVGRRPLS